MSPNEAVKLNQWQLPKKRERETGREEYFHHMDTQFSI